MMMQAARAFRVGWKVRSGVTQAVHSIVLFIQVILRLGLRDPRRRTGAMIADPLNDGDCGWGGGRSWGLLEWTSSLWEAVRGE